MSLFYRLAYGIGFAPWEKAASHPPAARQVAAIFDREQNGRTAPYGKALDIGCGTGHWAVELAGRGWEVTGIDIVPEAIAKARQRASRSGVVVRFVHGDIAALRAGDVGAGYRFLWDFGTLHGLSPSQRAAAAQALTTAAAADAALAMIAWAPGNRGPLPRGMSRAEVEAIFTDWRLVTDEPFDATGLPPPLRKVRPRCYRMRRV